MMKALAIIAIAAGLLSTCSEGIQLHRRADGAPRVVGFPIERQWNPNGIPRNRLRRRGKTLQATLDNNDVGPNPLPWIS